MPPTFGCNQPELNLQCHNIVTWATLGCNKLALNLTRNSNNHWTKFMKPTKRSWATLAATVFATGTLATVTQGQSTDSLINSLVKKGILTEQEAKDLKAEGDKDFTKAYSKKSGLPDWVTSLKFNGDFRGRYEGHYVDNQAYIDRHRYRYRLRFGATATLLDNFEVGLRLASANLITQGGTARGGNPVSANTDLGLGESRKFIFVDAAYGKWTPIRNKEWTLSGTIGKMDNPFALSSMVFDYDLQLEGAALQTAHNFNDQHSLKLNSGVFVLDEFNQAGGNTGVSPSHDPYFVGAQLLWEAKWTPKIETALGVSAFNIGKLDALNDTTEPNINAGNTRFAGQFANHFNPIVGNAAFTYKLDSFPAYQGAFPIKLAGEFIHNPAAPSSNSGWWGGVTFGKANRKRNWELFYRYQRLESDAWYEEFPDDDNGAFYAAAHPLLAGSANGANYYGGTNVKGHLVKASYSLTDFATLSLTYYLNNLITDVPGGSVNGAGHIMVDLMFKF